MIFALARRLRDAGVIGINARNAEFLLRYNQRRCYRLADDKFETKTAALRAGIAVPDLYAVVEFPYQVRDLPRLLGAYDQFVVKPAGGSGGDGIIVITGRTKNGYRLSTGLLMSPEELQFHVNNILSGTYSLANQPDKALFEYRVRFDPVFENVSYQGVPDVRVVVFLGVPVMAMVRLPTGASKGKANLHQGAIGAGIDIATGRTLTAVRGHDVVEEHPDTGVSVSGLSIPRWDELLTLSARSSELTGLGYQGIDIVLDRDKGPLILEINARPGLSIQIANRCGLLHRLRQTERTAGELAEIRQRVDFAKRHFGAHGRPDEAGRFAPSDLSADRYL